MNMSRATDAFSSLISNVPGVDTSCFVKRTLNDLKPKEDTPQSTTSVQSQQPVVEHKQPPTLDFSFTSADLDALGKPSTPQRTGTEAVVLEDLFEHIPGCEDPVKVDATTPVQDASVESRYEDQDGRLTGLTEEVTGQELSPGHVDSYQPQSMESQSENLHFHVDHHTGQQIGTDNDDERPSGYPSEIPQPIPETNNDVLSTEGLNSQLSPSYPASYYREEPMFENETMAGGDIQETSNTKTSDLKATFEKYRTTLNKKAVYLKKKGLDAMRQGFDAAQEWMDKRIEDRKQHRLTSSQKKEDAKRIEQFLAEMEQLSHYRREQLMAELPPEFFQRVMDYTEAKGIPIEHLFVTGREDIYAYESEPVLGHDRDQLEDEETGGNVSEVASDFQSQEACLEVTGEEESCHPSEEDCDLLGLSSDRPEDVIPETSHQTSHQAVDLVDPDDLDAFFGSDAMEETRDCVIPDGLGNGEEIDLMQFEGGYRSELTSDFSNMYRQLKQSGRHSESEIRTILKEARHQEKETKMAAALQAKLDRERESEARQEELHRLKEQHIQKISEWKEHHAGNMRGLLTTLQTVLWQNSGWRALSIGDVLEISQVKKAYMKANLIIHPDKVKQKGGTAEQVVVADMVFNVLKEAWKNFQT